MTKKEEIKMATEFDKGTEWADEHPKLVTIPFEEIENVAKEIIDKDWQEQQDRLWNMIERNLRVLFIRKACKWLKDYAHAFVSETTGDLNEDDLIYAFLKAMKGE